MIKLCIIFITLISSASFASCKYTENAPSILTIKSCNGEPLELCSGEVECNGKSIFVQCPTESTRTCPPADQCVQNISIPTQMCELSKNAKSADADKFEALIKSLEDYHNKYIEDGNQRLFELYVLDQGEKRLTSSLQKILDLSNDSSKQLAQALESKNANDRYAIASDALSNASTSLFLLRDLRSKLSDEKDYILSKIKKSEGLKERYTNFSNDISKKINELEKQLASNESVLEKNVQLLAQKRLSTMSEAETAAIKGKVEKTVFENSIYDIQSILDDLQGQARSARSNMGRSKGKEEYLEYAEDLSGIIDAARTIRDNAKKIIGSALTADRKPFFDKNFKIIDMLVNQIENPEGKRNSNATGPLTSLNMGGPYNSVTIDKPYFKDGRQFLLHVSCTGKSNFIIHENIQKTNRNYDCISTVTEIKTIRVPRMTSERDMGTYYDKITKEVVSSISSHGSSTSVISVDPSLTKVGRQFNDIYSGISSIHNNFNDSRSKALMTIADEMQDDRNFFDNSFRQETEGSLKAQKSNLETLDKAITLTNEASDFIKENAAEIADISISMTPVIGDVYDVANAIYGSITSESIMGDPLDNTDKMLLWIAAGPVVNAGEVKLAHKIYKSIKSPRIRALLRVFLKDHLGDLLKLFKELGAKATMKVFDTALKLGIGNKKLGKLIGTLREARQTKGMFGLGKASRNESRFLGESFVGPNYKIASDGKTLLSADGLKKYRPPSYKPKLGKTQANFEWRESPSGMFKNNGHLDIID